MQTKIATLALIVLNGKLLLGRKIRKGADIGEQTLNGPGGKREPEQTLFECLSTEVVDEVGLVILEEDTEEVAVITFHNGARSVFQVHVYLVRAFEGVPTSTEEMVEPEDGWWHAVDQLPFERMLASDKVWMPRALSGEHFRASVHQSEDGTVLERIEFFSY